MAANLGWSLRVKLLLWLGACAWAAATTTVHGIGVNYGMEGDNLPPPQQVVQLLQSTSISSVKLYSSDPQVLSAFAHSGISLVVGVENELIPALARSPKAARLWVSQRILPFFPASSVTTLAVGNEILTGQNPSLIPLLLPAMHNLQLALAPLQPAITVSTPNSMAVLSSSSPPSAAAFRPSLLPTLKLLLRFLSRTGSPFMVNAYPYFAYAAEPANVSLDYALFRSKAGVKDSGTGLVYGSLFDAQVDAVYYAIKAAGFDGTVPVVVSETGWPSGGDPNETGAGMENAQIYNSNLVKRVASGAGTPFKPTLRIPTFIFALFNENQKPGPSSERNFGLFQPNRAAVYDAGLLKAPPANGEPTPSNPVAGPPSTTPSPAAQAPTGVWCVANPGASDALLEQNLNFACGEGGADCSAIQPGQPCFTPNTLAAHASYSMNSYYQRHGRNYWNCFFNNAGLVTATNPSYGSCSYPSQ